MPPSTPKMIHGYPVATAHQSGAMLRVERGVDGAGGAGSEVVRDHAPEGAHDVSPRNPVDQQLNTRSVGATRLRSGRRLRARMKAANDLGEAMRLLGMHNPEIAAALDYVAEDVRRIRSGEKPFELGHLDMLPELLAAMLLARRVARLDVEAMERFEAELRIAREAA